MLSAGGTAMYYRFRALMLLVSAIMFLTPRLARADLITNGSFEVPTVTSGSQFLNIVAGSEPPGFGWRVTSGGVDVGIRGSLFASAAFDGLQFLDLDGFVPGAISQSFATIPGTEYILNFAYANNPQGPGGAPPPGCPFSGACATIPAHGTVSAFDSSTNTQLITPFVLTHGNSTVANPNWTPSGAIAFIAEGTTTTLSFVSNDPSNSDGGIF